MFSEIEAIFTETLSNGEKIIIPLHIICEFGIITINTF
jgi:hypothetical protein